MIARRDVPERYLVWNHRRGAPNGRRGWERIGRFVGRTSTLALRYAGEYAHQWNNDTRVFEYPYAFENVIGYTDPGARLIELGGGLSGLQFTLARTDRRVTNVDPGPARGWPLDLELHRRIAETLKAPVNLHPDVLSTYRATDGRPDLIYSVSALEHFSPGDMAETCAAIKRLLAPGGILLLTVDLFLALSPFTSVERNEIGTNIDLDRFLTDAGIVLVEGERAELHGFPEFSSEDILRRLHEFYVGRPFPTLIQCLVGRRSDE